MPRLVNRLRTLQPIFRSGAVRAANGSTALALAGQQQPNEIIA